jgi:hypothetical protein
MSPFNSKTRAAIWGLGGCGKTAVALEFVYRVHIREPDRAIFWIRASDRDHYRKAFRDIAVLYDIPGARDLEQDIMDAVRTKLMDKATSDWLIVVDNADDPEVLHSGNDSSERRLKDYLPSRACCKVLFTTRDKPAAVQLVGVYDTILEVEPFGLLEAQRLLKIVVPSATPASNHCKELLIELTCLPLAIVQAAAFMRENDVDIGTYLGLFREQDAGDEATDILGQEFEDGSRYPSIENALTKTWHISFKQLERRNYLSFQCLKYLACLECSDIPETLITAHMQTSHLDRIKIVGTLIGHQFLVRQRQGELFDMHPLIHLATRRWLCSNRLWVDCVQGAVTALSTKIPYGGYEQYNEYSKVLSHGICLLSHVDNLHIKESETTTDLLSRIAACQRDLGDHSGAEESHRAVLRWRRLHLESFHKKTLQAMQDVGQDLMMKGRYSDAESLHRKTFRLRFQYFGPADVETLSSMRNIAEALSFQDQWEEYEILVFELLKLSKAWLGATHTITLSSLKALSICYCRHGWFKLAEKLAREVVDGRKTAKGLGETHPSTLKSISHLAVVLGHNNKWEEAESLEMHTSTLLERTLGPKHPDTLTSKCYLARIWIHQRRLSAARDMFQEIFETRLGLLGPDHPDTLKSAIYISRFCEHENPLRATRHMPVEPTDPQHLIWSGPESEGDLLRSPPELDAHFWGLVIASEDEASAEPSAGSSDEEAAVKAWSLPWAQVDRTRFMWSCKSEDDPAMSSITSVLSNLRLVDLDESWDWLTTNIPALTRPADSIRMSSHHMEKMVSKINQPNSDPDVSSRASFTPSRRSIHFPTSIYRALQSLSYGLRRTATFKRSSSSRQPIALESVSLWQPSTTQTYPSSSRDACESVSIRSMLPPWVLFHHAKKCSYVANRGIQQSISPCFPLMADTAALLLLTWPKGSCSDQIQMATKPRPYKMLLF